MMKESLEFSFNPKFISAELAESLAQAIGQWIVQRREEMRAVPAETQIPDTVPEGQTTGRIN